LPNIVLTRIDDRLIHGQVMTSWVKFTKADRIVIVDDGVANDPFMGDILKMAVPSGIDVDIYGIQKAVEMLKDEEKKDKNIIILAKTPKTIFALIQGGVDIQEINVGGIGAGPGRKSLYKNISASAEEKEIFKKILAMNKTVYMQIVPDDKRVEIEKYL